MQNLHSPVRLRSAPPTSLLAWSAVGTVLGASAGICLAAFDLAASVPWLPHWDTRLGLALRLAILLPGAGGIAGGLLAMVGGLSSRRITKIAMRLGGGANTERAALFRRRLWPLPFLLLASPAAVAVGHFLFTGGSARRLPSLWLLEPAAALALLTGVYFSLRAGARLRELARRSGPRKSTAMGLALFLLAFVLARVDQSTLPNLYDYLHASLSVVTWLVTGLAIACIARSSSLTAKLAVPSLLTSSALLLVCTASLAAGLVAVGGAPDVRVALFDAHASNARSLMLGLEPLLSRARRASEDSVDRARRDRARRRLLASGVGLPSWEGAHVLLITIDAVRADHLGTYGHGRATSPALDALAADSIVFERAYAQAPHSSYSLSSLMTSEYLHETVELESPLPEATLATMLRAVGYETTAMFPLGIFHTAGERLASYRDSSYGFERTDHRDLRATAKTDAAIDALRNIARGGEPKSFLWVHYFDTHEPYHDTTFGTSDIDRYDSEIRRVDSEIERLLRAAAEILTRELIVVVTADHGEEFRDHGGVYHGSTLYDEQVRVPLIVRAPGLDARRVPAPVELVDIAPTLLAMVGVTPASSMRGDDLRALAVGRVPDVGPAFAGVGMKRMAFAPPYKLVADLRYDLHELYDLVHDPRERDNLARRDPEQLEIMRGELFAWLDGLRVPPRAEAVADAARDPRAVALERARLGDRRAADVLIDAVSDETEDAWLRAASARALGELDVRASRAALAHALDDDSADVRRESAIALGRIFDARATEQLADAVRELAGSDRARAAVALARLGDPRAVEHLPRAARDAEDRRDGTEAVRRLAILGGPSAFEPVSALLDDFDTRRQALLSLGTLGEPRAFDVLVQALQDDTNSTMRDASVQALGQLGDPRAIALLLELAHDEPTLLHTTEALVRLDTIGRGAIGGSDIGPEHAGDGLGGCEARADDDLWHFRDRTSCVTTAARVLIPLAAPTQPDDDGMVTVIVRLRRMDAADGAVVGIVIGDAPLTRVEVDGSWLEQRFDVPARAIDADGLIAILDVGAAVIAVDHILLLPRP